MNEKHMDGMSLVAIPGLRGGRGNVLNQMPYRFLNTVLENIIGLFFEASGRLVSLLSLKVRTGV